MTASMAWACVVSLCLGSDFSERVSRLRIDERAAATATGEAGVCFGLVYVPAEKAFAVGTIECGSWCEDTALQHLKSFPYVTLAILNEPTVFKKAGSPKFATSRISDIGFKNIAGLSKLERLDISNTSITDAGLVHLQKLQSLQILGLQGTAITGSGFAHLKELKELKAIHAQRSRVNDEGVTILASLPSLEGLSLDGTQLTDKGLVSISKCANLRGLSIGNTASPRISDRGVIELARLTKLTTLSVVAPITDEGLAAVASMPELTQLRLIATRISDKGLRHLLPLKKLQSLEISNYFGRNLNVTHSALEIVGELPEIKEVNINGTAITQEEARTFQRGISKPLSIRVEP